MTVTINLRKKIIKFFSFSYILFGLIFSSYLSAHVEDYDDENIEQYEEELDEIVTSINGIEYCRCFSHCSCFGHFTDQPIQGVFHQECFAAPIMPMNKVWHEFLVGILRAKQAGPYFIMDNSYLKRVVRQHNDFWGVIHTIPDYLYIIDFFRDRIYQVKIDKINSIKKSYTSSDEKEKLINEINKIEQEYQNANQILDRIPSVIIPLYQKAINICHHKLPAVSYHKGLMHSLNGDWYEALLEIQNFFELTDEKLKYTNLEPLLFFGEACLELHLYQDAITALTTVIQKNPKNKTAYFLRATAYFELGNFDEVLEDYLKSNRCGELEYPRVEVSNDFTEALLRSTVNGAKEAAVEFVPSLCNSVYGLGDVLWATAQHPVESIQDFSSACYEMGESAAEFCKNFDWDTIEECVDKARVLCENYHQLSDTEKGELFGYTIGKYGIGIFAGTTLFKGV